MLFKVCTLFTLVVYVQAKFYTDCGSKLATVQNVGVNDCAEDAAECILKRNTNATISVAFTPSKDVNKIETIVHGIIMNLPVPFPLPQPDACKDSGLTCPLKAGQPVSYVATFPILKSYPKVRVDIKWELKDENEEDLWTRAGAMWGWATLLPPLSTAADLNQGHTLAIRLPLRHTYQVPKTWHKIAAVYDEETALINMMEKLADKKTETSQ